MNGPLENELKERNERLETATERLSDRELEISILQKRLEIRSSVSKKGPNKINCLPDHQGGFQLLELIITELKSHTTCYNFDTSHWLK